MQTDTILRLLENGRWHHIKDLEKEAQLTSCKVEIVTKFLAHYNFIKLDKTGQKVKIDPPTNRFLKRIQALENEEKTALK